MMTTRKDTRLSWMNCAPFRTFKSDAAICRPIMAIMVFRLVLMATMLSSIISASSSVDELVEVADPVDLAGGIGTALTTTFWGLVVAIPAAMIFNYFTGRVENMVVDMDDVSSEFIDFVLKEGRA